MGIQTTRGSTTSWTGVSSPSPVSRHLLRLDPAGRLGTGVDFSVATRGAFLCVC